MVDLTSQYLMGRNGAISIIINHITSSIEVDIILLLCDGIRNNIIAVIFKITDTVHSTNST